MLFGDAGFGSMCTLILLRRPGHRWPLILAANRDELRSRAARPPAAHWPDRPGVIAGLDLLAGGSWLGLNACGLIAAVLNRRGSLGPATGKRSRGELVLTALDYATAEEAAAAVCERDPTAFRPFNLVVADAAQAFWLRYAGEGGITCEALPAGLSMLTAGELNDRRCPRIRRYWSLFARAPAPDPERRDFSSWQRLLGDRGPAESDPHHALCIDTGGDYGTVSSALIALAADPARSPLWLYADGPPDRTPFRPLSLAWPSPRGPRAALASPSP